MLRRPLAGGQISMEVLAWLGRESYSDTSARRTARCGHLGEAALNATSKIMHQLPTVRYASLLTPFMQAEHALIGMGSEATVLRRGDEVEKFLTGKSQEPAQLAARLQSHHETTSQYLGPYLPPTEIDAAHIKLFKVLPPVEYVRLRQPFIDIEAIDPHKNPEQSGQDSEIAEQLTDLADRSVRLFHEEGLLMDYINNGNLVVGRLPGDEASRVILLDTVPVDIAEPDFMGVHIPVWQPGFHVEALAEFALRHSPDYSISVDYLDVANM